MADSNKSNQNLQASTLGLTDGLVVPFALTAGLSSWQNHRFVISAGLAELFSGSISMGLGAYLAAVTEFQSFQAESFQLQSDIEKSPTQQRQDVIDMLSSYGVSKEKVDDFTSELCQDSAKLAQFVLDFQVKRERPKQRDALTQALIMAVSYFIGGLLPMIPYYAMRNVTTALFISMSIAAVILVVFGYWKAKYVGCSVKQSLQSALLTLGVGAAAAGASYGIVRAAQKIGA